MSKTTKNKKLFTEKKNQLTISAVLAIPPLLNIIPEYIKYFSK